MVHNLTTNIKSFFITAILFLALLLAVYSRIMIMYKKLARVGTITAIKVSLWLLLCTQPVAGGRGLGRPMGDRGDAHFQNKRRHYAAVQYNQRTHFCLMWGQFGRNWRLDKQNQSLDGRLGLGLPWTRHSWHSQLVNISTKMTSSSPKTNW